MASSETSSSSLDSPETCSSPTSPSIQMVSKSASDRLLGKFFDALQYDFDYEQSSLWSPPICRKVYLDSPAGNVCSEDEIFCKLKKKARKAWRRHVFCSHVCASTAFGEGKLGFYLFHMTSLKDMSCHHLNGTRPPGSIKKRDYYTLLN